MEVSTFYGGKHPSEIPFYTQRDVAAACNIPTSTLRGWLTPTARRRDELIRPPEDADGRLSFINLVEAYVISELRSQGAVTPQRLRNAVLHFRKNGVERPFLSASEWLVGGGIFLLHDDDLVEMSDWGQYVIRPIIENYISRVHLSDDVPITLYPAFGDRKSDQVAIDPRVRFGRPVIKGTGIRTSTVWERVLSHETIEDIAQGYELEITPVADALRYEVTRRGR